ncbi:MULTISPECIES: type I-E CRISPR-associated protein Cse2/CasB [unclassified Streptomyces]|uniref:type I-E CRISPR-associated protein Cse2/CasB n=1 Tax=unclassified Streptomyces TaxID=2593676 RepID=UPI00088D8C89|nr:MULTISPECIES: type I-E CRISPR-associated protein Cse2/CasB [unclassified Streptomyces]PBC87066.1 CRISPR system Cascade subunit CasB [Streptomyces sp. 2321.6]SDQ62729.1 CRISPR system Cascade subunit CasB/CRISPR system Cascade subunit CasA [Streptomyces sp. KS_16]SEE18169.1 CRISPR system Cascade subunit CasB [Streptomyces sp. 2133.1]SNC74241.1 CRISPR system Cascade subunit CasB [Streptomyces sp. 2114.4]
MTTSATSGERQQPGHDAPPASPGASSWLVEARQFVAAVTRVAGKDAGARAALRSGVGKGLDDVPRMHRIVAPLLPGAVLRDSEGQRAFYTVAALIAAYHRHGAIGPDEQAGHQESDSARPAAAAVEAEPAAGPGIPEQRSARRAQAEAQRRERFGDSMGQTYAAAVARGGRQGIRESAAETRLNLLCKQSASGLHRHLPSAVRQLCDRNTAPDWARLLVDLRTWPQQRKRVARWWLQDYYRARQAADLADALKADDASAPDGPAA